MLEILSGGGRTRQPRSPDPAADGTRAIDRDAVRHPVHGRLPDLAKTGNAGAQRIRASSRSGPANSRHTDSGGSWRT